MESWYFILGLVGLGVVFWLGSLSQTGMRLLIGGLGLFFSLVGLGLLRASVLILADTTWSFLGALQGSATAAATCALGLGALYSAYRLAAAALSKWN
jgi:hypothetical protein